MTLRLKMEKKEHRKHKKGVVFEDEVVELVKRQPMARPQLKEYLVNTHKGELGYSEKTIDTKLAKMIEAGIIDSLRSKDFPKYGIIETDKRIVYYVLKKAVKTNKEIEKVFVHVASDDPVVQKLTFEEIMRHTGEYFFDPGQLDTLTTLLYSKDDEFVNMLLDTLCEYILGRGIEPSNKNKLFEILRETLNRYKKGSSQYPNLRRHILWLLGKYRDSTVFVQLRWDAENLEDPIRVVSEYTNEYVSPMMEERSFDLLDLQLTFSRQGNEKGSEFISRIKDNISTPKNSLKNLEKNIELSERIKKLREERLK